MKDIVLNGDVYTCLDYIQDNSVTVVITSPPYWKQRDYGFKGQVGQEETPEIYIGRLLKIFSKLYKKLKDYGVFFLNIGDKYIYQNGNYSLLQIPYRLAYHMTKDGWILQDIIIWYKPNHMPASAKSRLANTYEPILVFTKSNENIYKKKSQVIEILLQQTQWKHTAVFPEQLVKEMLNRVAIEDDDIILDIFAGTGTTAKVVNEFRHSLFGKAVYSIMIEKSKEFVDIIKNRTKINEVIEVEEIDYDYSPVVDDDLPEEIKPIPIMREKEGEVYVVEDYKEFLSILKGISLEEFKNFHRKDAIFFFGIKNWNLTSLYYSYLINKFHFVLRNMIIISNTNRNNWYPVFMFAKGNSKVSYRFYLDKIRINSKTMDKKEWKKIQDFNNMKVINLLNKSKKRQVVEGYIVKVLREYNDGFPALALVQWNNRLTNIEFIIHPEKEEIIAEGLKFLCPKCMSEIKKPFDPLELEENICLYCGQRLWRDLDTVPLIQEPQEIVEIFNYLKSNLSLTNKIALFNIENFKEKKREKTISKSKLLSLERINWGTAPSARRILDKHFTKMRLYKINQSLISRYLNLVRKHKNMSIKNVADKFFKEYCYKVNHWFELGGSIPSPEEIEMLKKIFDIQEDNFLRILSKTALKIQVVKNSVKGKNPGDYFKVSENSENSFNYFYLLFKHP